MHLRKSIIILMGIAVISKLLGFIKDLIIANKFGASQYTDAFIAAPVIPIAIVAGFFSILSVGLIPSIQKKVKNGESPSLFLNQIFWSYLLLGLGSFIVYYIIAPFLLKLLYPGFNGQIIDLTITYSRIFACSLIALSTLYVVQAFLEYKEKFIGQSILSFITTSLFVFMGYLFIPSDEKLLVYLVYITVIGYFLNWILQITFINSNLKIGSFKKKNIFKTDTRSLISISIPVFLGNMIDQLNSMIDKALASTLEIGTISSMHYSYKISSMVSSLIPLTIAKVYFPKISKLIIDGNTEGLREILNKVIINALFIVSSVSILMIFISSEFVEIFFSNLNPYAEEVMKFTIKIYLIGTIFTTINIFLIKLFISYEKSKVIMRGAILSLIVNVSLSLATFKFFEYKGLAISNVIAIAFLCIYYLIQLHKITGINIKILILKWIIIFVFLFSGFLVIIKKLIVSANELFEVIFVCLTFGIIILIFYRVLRKLKWI